MLLWVIFALLTAVALTALLWPLARPGLVAAAREEFDASVYKDQLSEVEGDMARGLLGKEDGAAARIEISRRIIASAERAQGAEGDLSEKTGSARPVIAMVVAVVLVPFLSVGVYLGIGSPNIPDQPRAARLKAPVESNKIDEIIARVEARLRQDPSDGTGWDVIAPVYLKKRRYGDAADAFAKAIRIKGEDPRRLFGFGEATRLANNGIITEDARKAFARALVLDDKLLSARFRLAVAMEQDGRFGDAVNAWKDILANAPANLPWRGEVERRLAIADARANGREPPPETARPSISEGGISLGAERSAGPQRSGPQRSGPTQQQMDAVRNMSAKDRMAMITNMVNGLAERLKKDGSDAQGWLKLVQAYSVMGRRDDARQAVEDARKALAGNAQALSALDVLVKKAGLDAK